MPLQIKAEIKGLKQLERNLLALSKEFGDPKFALQAIRPALKKALQPIQDLIESKTPVDTGGLKSSIKLRITRPSKSDKANPNVGKDAVLIGKVGWFGTTGSSIWRKGLAVEFGNATTPAQPTLRPALESQFNNVVKTFGKLLGDSIEKKAKQLANKGR